MMIGLSPNQYFAKEAKTKGSGAQIVDNFFTKTILLLLLLLINIEYCFAYTIISPKSGAPVHVKARRAQFTLVIKADRGTTQNPTVVSTSRSGNQKISINPSEIHRKNEKVYFHFVLPLQKGENIFSIAPGNEKLNIHYEPVRTLINADFEDPKNYLFHREAVNPKECAICHSGRLPEDSRFDVKRLSKNAEFSPLCHSCHKGLHENNDWLHGPAANLSCMSCHRKEKGKTTITMLTGRVDEVCFQCHTNKRKIKDLKHVHGPVGTGDCTICHDPHGDSFKYQLWADGKVDLCLGCHRDKKAAAGAAIGFFSHGIIKGFGCVACHNPHASNFRFQLNKPINDLCISCHLGFKEVKKGHPVGSHPLSGKKDPRREGRELSCTSCHIPHGSRYRFLLIGDILGGHVCSKCHKG